jgi:hypothetical protein
MRGHGDKGRRDEEGEKKAPPLFTPLWGSPPGGPADMPAVTPPEAPAPPAPPASEQTLSPRIALPPPVKLRRLKPRELRKKPTPEPRLPHAFDVPTPGYLKNRQTKPKPQWVGITIAVAAIGLVALFTTVVGGKSKTSTTTTPKSSPAVTTQPAYGSLLRVTIDSPRENEVVESGTINVTGRVSSTGNQNVSGITITISIQAGPVATGTTDQKGSFSIPIQLLPQDNHMGIQASQGAGSGLTTRTCFYSCDPETYKAACSPLDYVSLTNSANEHKYERYGFNGRIYAEEFTKGENAIYLDTAYRNGEWTDRVVVKTDAALTVIPGDIIQIWGELRGQVTYLDERILEIEAAYIVPGAP